MKKINTINQNQGKVGKLRALTKDKLAELIAIYEMLADYEDEDPLRSNYAKWSLAKGVRFSDYR